MTPKRNTKRLLTLRLSARANHCFVLLSFVIIHPLNDTHVKELMQAAKIGTPYIAAWVSDRYGRRVSIMVGSVITVAGGFLGAFATSVPQFIGGRVLVGAGQAFHQAVAPPLLQELAHPRLRGICGASRLPLGSKAQGIRADEPSVSRSLFRMFYRSQW